MRFYLTPVRGITKKTIVNAAKHVEKETLIYCCGERHLVQLVWKSVWSSSQPQPQLQTTKNRPRIWWALSFLGLYSKNSKHIRDTYTPMFISLLFTTAKKWNHLWGSSAGGWTQKCGTYTQQDFLQLLRVKSWCL